MTDRALRDTVPSAPAASRNPTAEMREQLEGDLRESRVIITEIRRDVWVGYTVDDEGIATQYTHALFEEDAKRWLVEARQRARIGAWIPTVCIRCESIKSSPHVCETCLRGNYARE